MIRVGVIGGHCQFLEALRDSIRRAAAMTKRNGKKSSARAIRSSRGVVKGCKA